jgi:capsular polysaccharide export protein
VTVTGLRELPPTLYAHGLSRRKLAFVRAFASPSKVQALRRQSDLPRDATLLLWGRAAAPPDTAVIRVEDGFLRSVGLGADLIRPLSLAFDTRGIYFDSTVPSDLEHLLQNTSFDTKVLARAASLRERVVAAGITKYNVGAATPWTRPASANRVILVPGQVESDASIAWGAPSIKKNLDLLRAVRESNPNAHVLYKPHPDVVAGLRRAGTNESRAESFCDELVVDTPMGALLPEVDEVHTLTSLTGFEALLRKKKVVCYGQPFYAGWGLTKDIVPFPPDRRTRRVTLDAVVAAALILYPRYVSAKSNAHTTPESILDELTEAQAAARQRRPSRTSTLLEKAKRRILRRA